LNVNLRKIRLLTFKNSAQFWRNNCVFCTYLRPHSNFGPIRY